MTLCIKKDIFNENNLLIGQKNEINNNNNKIIICPLLYKYDKTLIQQFCFLTDWVHI